MPPVVLAVAAVAATGYSIYQGQQAAKAQNNSLNLQRQQQDLAAARQKRDSIRSARIAYAQAQQGAENQGVAASSSSLGGLGSINSQLSSNLSFLDQYKTLGDQASVSMGAANKYQASSKMWSDIGNLAGSAYGNPAGVAQGKADFTKVFGGG